MVIAVVLLARVMWRTHNRTFVFLSIFAVLNLLPVLPFPFIEHRYLYMPMMAAGVMLALLFQKVYERYGSRRAFVAGAALVLSLLAIDNGFSINSSAHSAAEWVSSLRAPFQVIEQQYPTLPKNTLLYFIDPITPTKGGIGGMAMLRYGPEVWVKDWIERADFATYASVHVFYFDDTPSLHEISGEKNIQTRLSNPLPVTFQGGIHLEGYEVPRVTISRSAPLVLVLYWRATRIIDRDYMLFAHLVAPNGAVAASYENSPRNGQLPISNWDIDRFTADAILLPVTAQVSAGSGYRVELGWYDAATRQRVSIVNERGQPLDDKLVLESFTVEP